VPSPPERANITVSEATGMIVGMNRAVEHEGRQFHVQVEDLGEAHACFEVRLHEKGGILWSKQVGYRDILDQGLPRDEQDDAIRASMEKMLHTVGAAISRGKLP
jgi:hypothetical protein